jgi:hypothetical protein
MHRRTLLLLALTVALLLGLAWWQSRVQDQSRVELDVPLFAGLEGADVDTIRLENLERDIHMKLTRASDAAGASHGRWRMVDPVDVPADDSLAEFLLRSALERRATPVPADEADAKKLGLEPPRYILELQASTPKGRVKSSVEFGALDLDGRRINVRAGGRLLRTLRDLDTTISRPLDDFKSHRVLSIDPREVIEVHRRGSLVQEGASAPTDLMLDAFAENGWWRASAPVSAALDPLTTGVWVQGLATLELDKYADQGLRLLGDFGLDPAEITITVSTLKDVKQVLRLGRPEHRQGQPWFGTVEGQGFVWFVEPRLVYLLGSPLESLLDRRLVRFPRDAIDGLRLEADGDQIHITRVGRAWSVSQRVLNDTGYTPPQPADTKKVEALLARLEKAELAGFLPGAEMTPPEVRAAIYVESSGDEQGGVFGAAYDNPGGGQAVRFQRKGDTIVALADPQLLDLARTPLADLWSLQLAEISEVNQLSLVLSGPGGTRTFARGSKGLWTPQGLDLEARELRDVLDPLLFLRASQRLPPGEHPALKEAVTVEFKDSLDKPTRFVLGLAPDGRGGERSEIDFEGRRSVLKDQSVHKRLLAILAMK